MILNKNLRIKIAKIVKSSGEGHIPSCFSIVDVINFLYENILTFKSNQPKWPDRDYFILSKGHGAGALFTVLEKNNFITESVLNSYGFKGSILGGHPDSTKVPGAEASTGSLGHGFPTSIGIALGLKIKHKKNKVICLIGDGECHEGTIWESANIGNNLGLELKLNSNSLNTLDISSFECPSTVKVSQPKACHFFSKSSCGINCAAEPFQSTITHKFPKPKLLPIFALSQIVPS